MASAICRKVDLEMEITKLAEERKALIAKIDLLENDDLSVSYTHLDVYKRQALEDVIDSCMEEGKKVIVFARFVPEIDAIARMLRKKNIGYALIKGDVKDRAEQVSAFQTDPDTKVFVGQ